MVTCSKCGCLNEDGVIFCRQCFQQVKVHSKKEIARMQQMSLCPQCNYYNPIEEIECIKCGTSLRTDHYVIRGKDGRESVIREVGPGFFASLFFSVSFALLIFIFCGIGYSSIVAYHGLGPFLELPAGKVFGGILLAMAIILGIEWEAGIVYRIRILMVFYLVLLALGTYMGPGVRNHLFFGHWEFPSLLLMGELLTLIFGVIFLLTVRAVGSILAPVMAFVGMYCILGPAFSLFSGQGIIPSIQFPPPFLKGVPFWLGPSFLIYHLFLPYTLLFAIGSALRALVKSMEKVDGTKSVIRFLNRRKEEARGELLNVFIVGMTLFIGFSIMIHGRIPNGVSLAGVALSRFFDVKLAM